MRFFHKIVFGTRSSNCLVCLLFLQLLQNDSMEGIGLFVSLLWDHEFLPQTQSLSICKCKIIRETIFIHQNLFPIPKDLKCTCYLLILINIYHKHNLYFTKVDTIWTPVSITIVGGNSGFLSWWVSHQLISWPNKNLRQRWVSHNIFKHDDTFCTKF